MRTLVLGQSQHVRLVPPPPGVLVADRRVVRAGRRWCASRSVTRESSVARLSRVRRTPVLTARWLLVGTACCTRTGPGRARCRSSPSSPASACAKGMRRPSSTAPSTATAWRTTCAPRPGWTPAAPAPRTGTARAAAHRMRPPDSQAAPTASGRCLRACARREPCQLSPARPPQPANAHRLGAGTRSTRARSAWLATTRAR